MIDVESQIFNYVAEAIDHDYANAFVTSEYVRTPPYLPCVMLVEQDNVDNTDTRTSSSNENHVVVMYEMNVFSNKEYGRKTEAKALAKIVDKSMHELGFTRTMLNPIPNENNALIYRIVGRYQAIVSKDEKIYRR